MTLPAHPGAGVGHFARGVLGAMAEPADEGHGGARYWHYGRWEMLCAFVLVDAEPARVAALASELADVPGVAEVYSVTGRSDLVAIVRVREHDELADIVTRRIGGLAGITRTETMVAFQAFSRHDLEAMWSVGLEGG